MLEVRHLYSYYGSSPVLQDVSFSLGKGRLLAVLGRNGVGKTTLVKTVMGLTDRIRGTLNLDDADVGREPTHRRVFRGIGYIPQGREIIPRFTVRENLVMGTFARPDGKREIPSYIYELFPVLREMAERRGGDLSGGQQQQLAIGRALAMEPKILLLDEPTEGIQPNIVEEIQQAIIRLNQHYGITVLLVEQNVPFARRAAHDFLLLDKGRVAAQGEIAGLTEEMVHRHMAV